MAEAEQALRRSRELLEAGETPHPTPSSTSDVFSASADWDRIRALSEDPAGSATMPLERWLERHVHPDDKQRVAGAIETASREKSPFELEHRSVSADGAVGTVRVSAVPLGPDKGQIIEWLVAARHE
jgi:hypothetical protein